MDLVDFSRIRVDAPFSILDYGAILPASFPKLVADGHVVFGRVVPLIMG